MQPHESSNGEFYEYIGRLRVDYANVKNFVRGEPLLPGIERRPLWNGERGSIYDRDQIRFDILCMAFRLREKLDGAEDWSDSEDMFGPMLFFARFELEESAIRCFDEFREMMTLLLGDGVKPWLESLWLAVLRHPAFVEEDIHLNFDRSEAGTIIRMGYLGDGGTGKRQIQRRMQEAAKE